MLYAATWTSAPTKVLTRSELTAVLADQQRRGARSANVRMNQVIARLACCSGLRVSEIGCTIPPLIGRKKLPDDTQKRLAKARERRVLEHEFGT